MPAKVEPGPGSEAQRLRSYRHDIYSSAADASDGPSSPSSVDEVWNQPYLFKINVGTVRGITTISSIEAVYLP